MCLGWAWRDTWSWIFNSVDDSFVQMRVTGHAEAIMSGPTSTFHPDTSYSAEMSLQSHIQEIPGQSYRHHYLYIHERLWPYESYEP